MRHIAGVEEIALVAELAIDLNLAATLFHQCLGIVLAQTDQRIAGTLREGDFVSRVGGDEFAILFSPTPGAIPSARYEQIAEAVRAPMPIGEQSLHVGVSIGAAQLEPGDDVAVELVVDDSKYGAEMPEELAEVLKQDRAGDKLFHALTSGMQRTLIYMIAALAQAAVLANGLFMKDATWSGQSRKSTSRSFSVKVT